METSTGYSDESVEMIDGISEKIYGIKRTEAIANGVCINCKNKIDYTEKMENNKPGDRYSPDGESEYLMTGICEYCFDQQWKEKYQ